MDYRAYLRLLKIFFQQSSLRQFALAATLGLAFSIAVVLSTVGIMDGFTSALRQGLRKSQGDVSLYSRFGFFFTDGKKL